MTIDASIRSSYRHPSDGDGLFMATPSGIFGFYFMRFWRTSKAKQKLIGTEL